MDSLNTISCRRNHYWCDRSLIPTAVIFAGYEGIISWMNDKFHVVTVFMKFVPIQEIMIYLLPLSLIVGIVIGLLGSSITIRKYLKV